MHVLPRTVQPHSIHLKVRFQEPAYLAHLILCIRLVLEILLGDSDTGEAIAVKVSQALLGRESYEVVSL